MIKTFRSRGAELLFARKSVALFQSIELAQGVELMVRRKLAQLNAAAELGSFFGTTAELWLNLQRDYDLQVAESAKLAFYCS